MSWRGEVRVVLFLHFKMTCITGASENSFEQPRRARLTLFNRAGPSIVSAVDDSRAAQVRWFTLERNRVIETHSLPNAIKTPLPLPFGDGSHDARHVAVELSICGVPGSFENPLIRPCRCRETC